MMKSQLRLEPHSSLPNASVVEVWHDGRLIATVAGLDGPGVRIISKHPLTVRQVSDEASTSTGRLNVCEVGVG